ncbi:PREDICTED: transcription factor ABORTED MICROSPORES-like [Prunus mume]|uniref:Transcription factor ABORTED MICROSPORES-like n=1 Tax=Prunus mume TaxID=102107 RepID=A0ABM1LZ46_PRUMU|nr:PREDICTED: transcription factor ABORTED MICROSPORES-like [Prunus mume]
MRTLRLMEEMNLVFQFIQSFHAEMQCSTQEQNSCDLLAQLPSSLSLDSGIYAHPLISNQPIWLNSSSNRDSSAMAERDETRVLVPNAEG